MTNGGIGRVRLLDASAWFRITEFDGTPGDELVVANHHAIRSFRPLDLESAARSQFPEGPAVAPEPVEIVEHRGAEGSQWSWYSTVTRLNGRPVIVQMGGGYSETEVLDLSGEMVFRHHPDPKLPPQQLLPADLERDGDVEFYAAGQGSIRRLDSSGETVWQREAPLFSRLLLERTTEESSAWVVAVEHQGGMSIWNPRGELLQRLDLPVDDDGAHRHVEVVDVGAGRRLLVGGAIVRAYDLEGNADFQHDLDGMRFVDAASWQPEATVEDPEHFLALVAQPDVDIDRWRLLVFDSQDRIVYNEVLSGQPRLLRAEVKRGRSALFLNIAADGLWWLGVGGGVEMESQ